ncbi:MAG: VWA domain-containing protein [Acidiferrobacterales bacterium]
MVKRISALMLVVLAALSISSCGGGNGRHAMYMVVDVSGTYARQSDKARDVLKYLLITANPGDTLALARINSRSYTEKNIVAKVTLENVPSKANAQKKDFAAKVDRFVRKIRRVRGSAYTDISGALILATEFLRETKASKQTIVIFSDMKQELGKGTVRNFDYDVKGIRFVVINIAKLRSDNVDPRRYKRRMEAWQKKLLDSGATEWVVITDMDKVLDVFPS